MLYTNKSQVQIKFRDSRLSDYPRSTNARVIRPSIAIIAFTKSAVFGSHRYFSSVIPRLDNDFFALHPLIVCAPRDCNDDAHNTS